MFPEALLRTTLVTAPAIRVDGADDWVELVNEPLGASLRTRSAATRILEHFRQPRLLATALEELDVDLEIIADLLRHAMVVDVDLLFTEAHPPIGEAMKFSAFLANHEPADVLFGAASDNAVSGRSGARQGPREIRTHTSFDLSPGSSPRPFQAARGDDDWMLVDLDFRRQYAGPIPRVIDVGDIRPIPGESTNSYGSRVRLVASLIRAGGGRPLMLGGDHSMTAFVLDALLEDPRPFGILHFDAHHDLSPSLSSRLSFVSHGNPFFRVRASDSLVRLFQLGLRGVQPMSRSQLVRDPRISCRTARELQHLRPEQAFEGVSDEIPYYLTFDIDCFDPTIAPETGTPLAGGLSYYQAMDLVDYAARRFDLLGWDIVEVSQGEERWNRAAVLAGQLIKRLILANASYQPLDSYLEEPPD